MNISVLVGEAVLDFGLQIIGETVAKRGIDAPGVVAPLGAAIVVADGTEELLVPAQSAEKLRSNFVFGFKIVGEGVGVADPRDFKARFEKFRPQLQPMPCKRGVLSKKQLAVVADAATGWKRGRCFREQIRTAAGGKTEGPHLVRAKADPAAKGRMFETDFGEVP